MYKHGKLPLLIMLMRVYLAFFYHLQHKLAGSETALLKHSFQKYSVIDNVLTDRLLKLQATLLLITQVALYMLITFTLPRNVCKPQTQRHTARGQWHTANTQTNKEQTQTLQPQKYCKELLQRHIPANKNGAPSYLLFPVQSPQNKK